MALETAAGARSSSLHAVIMSAARFTKRFFYTFLDISGILLGVFLVVLGAWVISGRSISEVTGVVVLILGIAAFIIHSGHYFQLSNHTLDIRLRDIFS
jgi:hypothetical protein